MRYHFTSHKRTDDGEVVTVNDGDFSAVISAPRTLDNATERFTAHIHGVMTFISGCVVTGDTVVRGTKTVRGDVAKYGHWLLNIGGTDYTARVTRTQSDDGTCTPGPTTFTVTRLTPSAPLLVRIAVSGTSGLTAKGTGTITVPNIETQPGGGYHRTEIGHVEGAYSYSLTATRR